MQPLAIYTPDQLTNSAEPANLGAYAYRFLAKGDSWFSVGTLNPAKHSNLLYEMEFQQYACAVTCSYPGDTLEHMAQMNGDRLFARLLFGKNTYLWDGLLISCGGNDLIDALQSPSSAAPALRLLRPAAEWGPESDGPARYLSTEGWQTFSRYLQANFKHLLGMRDAGPSKGCPVFLHGYACPTPRDAGAGLGLGPWLQPALVRYGIPTADWIALGALLIHQLAALLAATAADQAQFPNLHFFDTSTIAVNPAALGSSGESGDWVNEIHLTWRGYEKLAMPWAAAIEAVMQGGA